MDAGQKLQKFYNRCNNLPEVITRESILENLYNGIDRLAIEESLKAGTLADDALKALRGLDFTYKEIGALFRLQPSMLRKRVQRFKDLHPTG